MSHAQTRAQLEAMTAATSEPPLTESEILALLDLARRADADGLEPTHAGWTPTYDLPHAAAEGWRWKAGKVAGDFDVVDQGMSLRRSQAYAACLGMAVRYARQSATSVPLTTVNSNPAAALDLVVGNQPT